MFLSHLPTRLLVLLVFAFAPFSLYGTEVQEPAAQQKAQVTYVVMKQLFFAESEEAALAIKKGKPDEQVVVHSPAFFANDQFIKLMTKYVGQPISDETVVKIAGEISTYVQAHDRLTAHVKIPPQNASDGTLRLVVRLGCYKDISFKGNRWFSSELLAAKLGVKPGDEIRVSTLEQGINWINTNPFRRIHANINNVEGDPTKVNLILAVQEQMPLRVIAMYDNNNVKLLGEHRYTAAITYGNLWGLDHQLTYQLATTSPTQLFQVHNLDYRVPLPWHHYLQFVGAYAMVEPTFYGGLVTQKGQNVVASAKYIFPYIKGSWVIEFNGGVEFKQANNNLEFGGTQFSANKYDVLQGTIGATFIRRDKKGAWTVSTGLSISPGHLTPRNTDKIFNQTRPQSDPAYLRATLTLERGTQLAEGWEHVVRGNFQTVSKNVVGSEQLSIGGSGTVRGYEERIFSGDLGYTLTSELYAPAKTFTLPKKWLKEKKITVRALAFFDCGEVQYYRRIISDGRFDPLMSSGIGLRCNAANMMSVSFDYGWRWKKTPNYFSPGSGRAHIQATIAF